MPKPAVIVVSSHVARGSVGGRASVFALERMGFPVWLVPTVLLPWHPGHGRATRIAPDNGAFASLTADLARSPWLGEVGAILTGYFGAVDQVAAVADLVRAVREANPTVLYLCDPILGDSGGLFQPEALVVAIRDLLIPHADIALPNRHELGWLTAGSVDSNNGIVAAARELGPREVVTTSAHAADGNVAAMVTTGDGSFLASHRRLADVPHGTGDLLAALYLGHRLDGIRSAEALSRASSSVLRLVERAARSGVNELPLAGGQGDFLAPPEGVMLTPVAEVP